MARRTADEAARRPRPPAAAAAITPNTRRQVLLATLGVLALALWAYGPALHAGWIWDDDLFITINASVKAPGGLWDIFFGFYRDVKRGGALVVKTYQYYPLVYGSFWLEHELFGLEPMGYHALNVLLHLLNAWLVFRLARRLAIPGAGFVAALFALHPMMVESVAWVSERKNVLSGFFYLAAFLAYLRFDDDRRPRWWAASFLLFLCALLSKTVTATLPCALLLAVYWRRGKVGVGDAACVLPFVVAGVGLGWLSVHLEQYSVG